MMTGHETKHIIAHIAVALPFLIIFLILQLTFCDWNIIKWPP